MIAADLDLDALFKRLHLANARRVWRDLVQRAEREAWSYHDFLTLVAAEEIAHRQHTRLARLTRRAHLPVLKTIDDFNFSYQSTVRLPLLGSALTPDFVTEGRSLIFMGKPGRGKTHLAVAIAYRAIQNGFDAFFTTAATLIDDLSAAFRAGQLADALPAYTHPAVLIVDEVGYLTYGTDAANMLFHVVNERHRRHRAMIFTTNKSLKGWGRVLHDEDLAQAILDRVLERGRLLRLDGPSVRTLHVDLDDAMKDGSDQEGGLIRVSGKSCSEFPEPTIRIFLERRGHPVSAERTYRLWRQAGLQVPKRRPRRRIATGRPRPTPPTTINQVWAYDFVFDTCVDGRSLKCLTVVDKFTRECLAIDVAGSIRSGRVIEILTRLVSLHGAPRYLRSDNGPEFVATAVLRWLHTAHIETAFIRAGAVESKSTSTRSFVPGPCRVSRAARCWVKLWTALSTNSPRAYHGR